MLVTLLLLVALFALLFLTRVSGARRGQWLSRWPAVVLAGAALFVLARGGWVFGAALALAAAAAWEFWPRLTARAPAAHSPDDPADQQARAILGVGPAATPSEIRAAYRAKMAAAHPDRGGTHAEAARLTGARDRLLRRKR